MVLLQLYGPCRYYELHLAFSVVDAALVVSDPSFLVHDKFPRFTVLSSFDALSFELQQTMLPAFVTSFQMTDQEY